MQSFEALRLAARECLSNAFDARGRCVGRLSDSALGAALAAIALHQSGRGASASRGAGWLETNQNPDGGWGDTSDSPSNLATTLLSYCALETVKNAPEAASRAREWVRAHTNTLEPKEIAAAVAGFYGRDRTFSVPILSVCAATGILGPLPEAWRYVQQLPFEAARVPRRFYKWLRLPVVSYALPALIAIGLARHRQCPSRWPTARWLRDGCAKPALRLLREVQPASGGFLEAIPLTAFVAINLLAAGERACPVLGPCLDFLEASQRPEGGWPIDINLATWTTSLATHALGTPDPAETHRRNTRDYLLACQQRGLHPFTQAEPGGWGWTDLSGSVPDADDTSAALLALRTLEPEPGPETTAAARAGVEWLLALQNSDGGIPTFCRGWTNLPFDRSCPDITAHVLAAFSAWRRSLPALDARMGRAQQRALRYLERTQRKNGAWIPLWFGNQAAPDHENPVFGTARVLDALTQLDDPLAGRLAGPAARWLIAAQNDDGGWGGAPGVPSSVEETALALAALATRDDAGTLENGLKYLVKATREGHSFPAAPIGLYFSSLWYSEALYPVVFVLYALDKAISAIAPRSSD